METLTIHVAGPAAAQEMLTALSGFEAEVVEIGDGRVIVINLGGSDSETVGVLNALQEHVTERAAGAARLDFHGHRYVMHPEPAHSAGTVGSG